jgi:hypothetical protein
MPKQDAEFTNLTFRPAGGAEVMTTVDLRCISRSGEIAGSFVYHTDLFNSRTMRRMNEHFVRLIGLFGEIIN